MSVLSYPRTFIEGKQVRIHRLVTKAEVGKVVHHLDGNLANNCLSNLLVCTQAEHVLIHKQERALATCGNATWLKCPYCKVYDDPKSMKAGSRNSAYHPKCKQLYNVAYNKKQKLNGTT